MDYKYDSGIELLLAHMNVEDIINAAETLYRLEEEEEGETSFEDEEGLSQEEMDENEEAGEVVGLGSEQKNYADEVGGVRYGTVTDLLSFVNLLSSMQAAALSNLPEEMGVLLNKVRIFLSNSNVVILLFDVVSLEKLAAFPCFLFFSPPKYELFLCRRTWL